MPHRNDDGLQGWQIGLIIFFIILVIAGAVYGIGYGITGSTTWSTSKTSTTSCNGIVASNGKCILTNDYSGCVSNGLIWSGGQCIKGQSVSSDTTNPQANCPLKVSKGGHLQCQTANGYNTGYWFIHEKGKPNNATQMQCFAGSNYTGHKFGETTDTQISIGDSVDYVVDGRCISASTGPACSQLGTNMGCVMDPPLDASTLCQMGTTCNFSGN